MRSYILESAGRSMHECIARFGVKIDEGASMTKRVIGVLVIVVISYQMAQFTGILSDVKWKTVG